MEILFAAPEKLNAGIPQLASEIGPIRMPVSDLYHFRFGVFKEKLGWDVPVVGDSLETDEYDQPHAAYLIAREADVVIGCMRLLPTTTPYMLKDTFPDLLCGAPAPQEPDVWEVSRFACEEQGGGGGISRTSLSLMQEAIRFAVHKGIKSYVIVTTAGFERLIRRLGVETRRYGPMKRIGKEWTVAFDLPINAANVTAFLCPVKPELHYETNTVKEVILEPLRPN